MIQLKSRLIVADNSGAHEMRITNIYGATGRHFASVGDIVQCVVTKAEPDGTVKAHEMVKSVIIRTVQAIRRVDGSVIRFDDNAAVVIDTAEDKNPRGTRVFGPVARELKDLGYEKIVSMAEEVF